MLHRFCLLLRINFWVSDKNFQEKTFLSIVLSSFIYSISLKHDRGTSSITYFDLRTVKSANFIDFLLTGSVFAHLSIRN